MFKYQIRSYSDKKIEAVCPVCGTTFIKNAFNHRFCSPLCKSKWNEKMKKEKKRVRWN